MARVLLVPMVAFAVVLALPASAMAQATTMAPAAVHDSSKALYGVITNFISRSAEKMPEEHFSFRPSPDVRTYGQILGHVADAQYQICGMALGEKPPAQNVEKTKTTKADLSKALTEAFGYCEKAHATLNGPKGAEIVDAVGGKHPRLGVLYFNTMHNFEHYGNLVTYLRMKGIVPPSSEPRQTPPSQ